MRIETLSEHYARAPLKAAGLPAVAGAPGGTAGLIASVPAERARVWQDAMHCAMRMHDARTGLLTQIAAGLEHARMWVEIRSDAIVLDTRTVRAPGKLWAGFAVRTDVAGETRVAQGFKDMAENLAGTDARWWSPETGRPQSALALAKVPGPVPTLLGSIVATTRSVEPELVHAVAERAFSPSGSTPSLH